MLQEIPDFAERLRWRLQALADDINFLTTKWAAKSVGCHDLTHGGKQLLHLNALSNLGCLAAGIVHEIKNPLSSVKGFLQILFAEWPGDDKGLEYINIMLGEIEDINQMANEILILARPDQGQREYCRVNEIVEEVVLLLEGQAVLQDVKIERIMDPSVMPPLLANRKQLKQMFLNLGTNALQAMEQGGTLTFSAEHRPFEGGLLIKVKDTGCGIREEELPHIFTPFYSTKPRGGGLGLAIVYRIVTDHGGNIEVSSEVGKGTVFTVWLPCSIEDEIS